MHSFQTKVSAFFSRVKKNHHTKPIVFIFSTFGLYFIYVFSKILVVKPDGLYAGHPNVWSDWALHITLTNIFALKDPSDWFAYHPYFSGGKLTYAFLTNMISGLLMRVGFTLPQAMILPSIIYILLFLLGLYAVFFMLLKSRTKAVLAIWIYLTSAGMGIFTFIKEYLLNKQPNLFDQALVDYTRIEKYQWLAGNIPSSMLVPQRSFLLGGMLALWSLFFLLTGLQKKSPTKYYLAAGVLAGILPIAHMHSFIALVVISGCICFFNRKKYKQLIAYIIPAGILSSMLYFIFIKNGIENPSFMTISFGWTSEKNLFSWIHMWIKIWGIALPVSIFSVYHLAKHSYKNIHYFLGFLILFAIGNIVILQPIAWDNSKIFAWVYMAVSLLCAHTIVELVRNKTKEKLLAIILLFLLTATGFLELIHLQQFSYNTYRLSSTEEISFATQVRKYTKPNDLFLTATTHNHPIQMWAARPIVLGYTAWAINFGFTIQERESDIFQMYQNPRQSARLIEKYKIKYIVVGPDEKRMYRTSNSFFAGTYPVAFQNENTTIFKVGR